MRIKLKLMKSNELKIGNYANINVSNGEEIVKITKGLITSIEKDCVYINDIKVELRFLEPISLTEEILLKCEFEKNFIDDVFEIGEFSIRVDELDCVFMWNGFCIDINLKYLHQLQNLYFALTNEELIINL